MLASGTTIADYNLVRCAVSSVVVVVELELVQTQAAAKGNSLCCLKYYIKGCFTTSSQFQ